MSIIATFSTWLRQRRANKQKALQAYTTQKIATRVQLREFEGGIYISFDNVPMIQVQDMGHSAIATLEKVRSNVAKYINSK